MKIDIDTEVAAILQAQVASGAFSSVEEALRAAVFGAPLDIAPDQDLSWAKPLVDAADGEVEAGATVDAKEAFAAVLKRIRES